GGARRPGRAADDEERARRELRVARAAAWNAGEQSGRPAHARGWRHLEPDVRDDDAARVKATRRDDEADLAGVEGHGHVGVDGGARRLAGGRVYPGRKGARDT